MRVAVIGGGRVTAGSEAYAAARSVGGLLAEHGHTVVCGGRGGVMEAACCASAEQERDREAHSAQAVRRQRGTPSLEQSGVARRQHRGAPGN